MNKNILYDENYGIFSQPFQNNDNINIIITVLFTLFLILLAIFI